MTPDERKVLSEAREIRRRVAREPVEPRRATFTPAQIDRAFCEQEGFCAHCVTLLSEVIYHADHIVPVDLGGKTEFRNLQLLCVPCHKAKTREDIKRIRKAARLRRDADPETRRRSKRPMRGRGFQKADDLK